MTRENFDSGREATVGVDFMAWVLRVRGCKVKKWEIARRIGYFKGKPATTDFYDLCSKIGEGDKRPHAITAKNPPNVVYAGFHNPGST